MSTVKKVAKNSLIIFAGEIIVRVITFFITLILIRYLGSGDFGRYSVVYAFLSFFQIFVGTAIDPIILRELSRDSQKGRELIGSAITLRFFFSLIGLILCWIALQWMPYPRDIKIIIYLASLWLPFSFGLLFNNIFQAKLSMKSVTLVTVMMKIFLAIFTVIFIFLKAQLFYFILINLLIYIAQIILIYYQSRKLLSISVKVDLRAWKELVKNSWPLTLGIIFASIFTRIDQILLFQMKGKEELGLYAAAVKLAEYPFMVAGAFLASVSPLLFEHAITSPDIFKRIYQISLKYLMMFIIPIAVVTTVYSREIILVCYGRDFIASQAALAILIWSTVFAFGGIVQNDSLIATNLQLFSIIFTGIPAFLSVFLNLMLIPKYSLVGAAIATTVSYGINIPMSYLLKRTRIFAIAVIKSMIKPFLASLLAVYSVYFLSFPHIIFNFILTLFIYLFLIFLIGEIDLKDIKYGKEILFSQS